jgi:prolyl-tRNA synthetase
MRFSKHFPKTLKVPPADATAVNHQLLVRGGFMDQLMAGSWTLLPLGLRVVTKINNIIREELNKTDAAEMAMPLLHPREIWDQTGRWSDPDVKEIMYQFKDIHDREFCLSFTHEEIVMNLLGKTIESYKDLPVKVYQFSTKFRNELRAKSGIMRGREFLMKDLYSAHVSEENMLEYYEKVKQAYVRIFERIGFKVMVAEASGGVFTDKHTHEFQVENPAGEDIIYFCKECDFAQNKEVFEGQTGDKCQCGKGDIEEMKATEVGNIFPLGTRYSEKMKVFFKDENGENKPIWFASYGIGPTRVMGTLVEVFHDDRGIIWPEAVAPFQVHLIGLDLNDTEVKKQAEETYQTLLDKGVEVIYDDREDITAGAKFADYDLIGIPYRLVISRKTGDKIEFKKRGDKDFIIMPLNEVMSNLSL